MSSSTLPPSPLRLPAARRGTAVWLGAVLAWAILCWASPARSAELAVCPTCDFTTIASAVSAASAGDTVLVQAGTYREGNLVIDRPVALLGQGMPVLDGQRQYEVVTVKADDVTVKGFVIRDSGESFTKDIAGLRVAGARRCRIEGNRLENTFFAIYLAKAKECVVKGNVIQGTAKREAYSGNGIHAWASESIVIEDNVVRGQRDGIYLEFLRMGEVSGNVSEGNLRYGMHYMYSKDSRYRNNTFRRNGAGVAVMYSSNIEMTGNVFADNWGAASYGVLLKDLNDSLIAKNVFRNNTIGLFVDGANRLTIDRNDVVQNGWGVRLMANTMGIAFMHNNFIGNTFAVTTNGTATYNSFLQNYWSDYRGYDLDHNGFGDVPHRPVTLFGLLVEEHEEFMVFLHSPLADALNTAERLMPSITPQFLADSKPVMYRIAWSKSEK